MSVSVLLSVVSVLSVSIVRVSVVGCVIFWGLLRSLSQPVQKNERQRAGVGVFVFEKGVCKKKLDIKLQIDVEKDYID